MLERREFLYLGAKAFAGLAAESFIVKFLTACSSQAPIENPTATQKPSPTTTQTSTPAPTETTTPTKTAVPTSTATASPTKESATPTPEGLKLGNYDVFLGKTDGGDKVLLTTLPNGEVLFFLTNQKLTCSNPSYYVFAGAIRNPKYNSSGGKFDFTDRSTKQVTGTFVDTTTITGTIVEKGRTPQDPDRRPMTCGPASLNFTATKLGEGKNAFFDGYRRYNNLPSTYPAEQIETNLKKQFIFPKLDLPEN